MINDKELNALANKAYRHYMVEAETVTTDDMGIALAELLNESVSFLATIDIDKSIASISDCLDVLKQWKKEAQAEAKKVKVSQFKKRSKLN